MYAKSSEIRSPKDNSTVFSIEVGMSENLHSAIKEAAELEDINAAVQCVIASLELSFSCIHH